MKSYKFSMESILNLRENKEKSTMENLAKVQNQLEIQKDILKDLIMEEEKIKSNCTKLKDIHELRHHNLYKEEIEEKISKQDELIDKTNIKLEEVRRELIEAQKERKIMEKLKEKDMDNYINNMRQVEQKELDEIAVLKYAQLNGFQ